MAGVGDIAASLLDTLGVLVKEIRSRAGHVHFRRWAIVETDSFSLYVHNIRRADEEEDTHDHPWRFLSFVLAGGYEEFVRVPNGTFYSAIRKPRSFVYHPTEDAHRIIRLLTDSSWTLVATGARKHDPWGYWTDAGWVDHVTYRKRKNERRAT